MPRTRTLNFNADIWHGHISIRSLSLEARGLLVDMAANMNANNEMVFPDGKTLVTSATIGNISGTDVENVLLILEELKSSGAIIVEDGKPIKVSDVFRHKPTRKQ
jgi:homoaconitase/3-isopropylmalate dehydratase large subunit